MTLRDFVLERYPDAQFVMDSLYPGAEGQVYLSVRTPTLLQVGKECPFWTDATRTKRGLAVLMGGDQTPRFVEEPSDDRA